MNTQQLNDTMKQQRAVLTESILAALGLFFGFLTNMAFTKL